MARWRARARSGSLILLLAIPRGKAKLVTVSNTRPRFNVSGEVMDAHDGSYSQWSPGGPWYYYAMGYGSCRQRGDLCDNRCGYGYSWIGVWRSPDMRNGTWQLVREARDDTWPPAVYFRVHVVFNPSTRLYVLWVNVNQAEADYFVGTSTSPEGPFAFRKATWAGLPAGGDFDILVDDDPHATAYLIYTAVTTGHVMSVERLAPDYLSSAALNVSERESSASSGLFGSTFVEAPAIFKRRGIYYALFGGCCCFCSRGSGIGVYTARQPLGPWTHHNNVGCGRPLEPGCGCGMDTAACPSEYGSSLTGAQQNFVIQVDSPSGMQYIWTGDRWQSAADGVKAHDLQYWSVLKFEASSAAGGLELPAQLVWEDSITFEVPEPEGQVRWEALKEDAAGRRGAPRGRGAWLRALAALVLLAQGLAARSVARFSFRTQLLYLGSCLARCTELLTLGEAQDQLTYLACVDLFCLLSSLAAVGLFYAWRQSYDRELDTVSAWALALPCLPLVCWAARRRGLLEATHKLADLLEELCLVPQYVLAYRAGADDVGARDRRGCAAAAAAAYVACLSLHGLCYRRSRSWAAWAGGLALFADFAAHQLLGVSALRWAVLGADDGLQRLVLRLALGPQAAEQLPPAGRGGGGGGHGGHPRPARAKREGYVRILPDRVGSVACAEDEDLVAPL